MFLHLYNRKQTIKTCIEHGKITEMRLLILGVILAFLTVPSIGLPSKVYLPVPFLCQAPYANWDHPWQEGCEEAGIIMALHYIKGTPLTPAIGNQEILDLVDFQVRQYGGHRDLTAEQCAGLIKDYYKYDQVEVLSEITVEDIKKELAGRHLVLAPMAGRLLRNPYYTPPGPAYHYILFKGYDDRSGEFITNDMGTRRGKDYRYKYKVAYNAIHDWTGSKETINQGRKAAIVIK